MVRHSANSLKSKIKLAVTMLAFFVCSFGIGSYLLVSLFTENTIYTIAVLFLFSGLVIAAFGWWLAGEAISPIEKVSLLAKSLERGTPISLPKSSGSSETDELLATLHRNNHQLQNLVNLMDKVSSGNLNVALTPLQTGDRLTNSFQKLLAKVTDSIDAKQNLERLEEAVRQITEEIARVKNGNFDVEIKLDFPPTREICETLMFLIRQLNELAAQVKTDSRQTQNSSKEVQKTIQNLIAADERRVEKMKRSTLTLRQIPQAAQKISDELSDSVAEAQQSIEKTRHSAGAARENLSAVGTLRLQIREAIKRVGRLNERSIEIGKISKTIEDLAQRTNMISLNASIQAVEAGEQGRIFVAFAEEVERLAVRAANTNKQISTVNKAIAAEIGEVEHSLQESVGETAHLTKFAIESGNALEELERYIARFLSLQENLAAFSTDQSVENAAAFQTFFASIAETETSVKQLRESEAQISRTAVLMENLHLAVAEFKVVPIAAGEIQPANEFSIIFEPSLTLDGRENS